MDLAKKMSSAVHIPCMLLCLFCQLKAEVLIQVTPVEKSTGEGQKAGGLLQVTTT